MLHDLPAETMMRVLLRAADAVWSALGPAVRVVLGAERVDRLLDSSGLRRVKYDRLRQEMELPGGVRLRYRPYDRCIIEEVWSHHAYSSTPIKEGEVVVDIGAHIGAFALYASRRVGPAGRVIACEPSPDSLELLRENVARNASGRVTVFGCALADKAGTVTLYVGEGVDGNPAADTLVASAGRRPVAVEARTLDALLEGEKVERIDHLKIDVEGAELQVLRGAALTLERARRVILEIHPPRASLAEVRAVLEPLGFACRPLSEKPLVAEFIRR